MMAPVPSLIVPKFVIGVDVPVRIYERSERVLPAVILKRSPKVKLDPRLTVPLLPVNDRVPSVMLLGVNVWVVPLRVIVRAAAFEIVPEFMRFPVTVRS